MDERPTQLLGGENDGQILRSRGAPERPNLALPPGIRRCRSAALTISYFGSICEFWRALSSSPRVYVGEIEWGGRYVTHTFVKCDQVLVCVASRITICFCVGN